MLSVNENTQNNPGIVASTSSLIAQLIKIYMHVSVLNSALNIVNTKTERSVGQSQADNITQSAEQKAKATRWQSAAGIVSGTLELAGGAYGAASKSFENKGLQEELDNIGNYKTEVNDALNTSRDSVLSNSSSAKEVENARGVKESMRKMTCREDFTGLDKESEQFMNDTKNIWSAETDDLNALDKHLDELSLDKKKQMQSNANQEMVMLVSKGLGGVSEGIGGLVAANHTTKAGKYDAASSLDQTSVGMLRESAQQASKTADKYAQEESQAIEMLVQLSQADVFRGS